MQITSTDEDGQITIHYDSRWQDPTQLGYKPSDPEYKLLRRLWEDAHKEDYDETQNQDSE